MSPLLVVADAFAARAGGTHVLPKVTLDRPTRAPFAVVIRAPDGVERAAQAQLDVMHVRGPSVPFGMLRLIGVAPEEIAIGSEIRLDPA